MSSAYAGRGSYSDSEDEDAEAYFMEEHDIGGVDDACCAADRDYDTGHMSRAGAYEAQKREDEDRLKNIDLRMERILREEGAGREADGPPEGLLVSNKGGKPGISSQTGPKGVKADYEEAKKQLRTQRMMERVYRERQINRQIRIQSVENLINPTDKTEEKNQVKQEKKNVNNYDSQSSESEEDSDDESFRRYKLERIQAVQNSLPIFGVHTRVSKAEFAKLVKEVHELCYVVCHIYQNHLESCTRLNFSLEALAEQFVHVKFCRLKSDEISSKFSDAGLPAFMIYRGGEMVAQALRVTDVLPADFTDLDVAKLLQTKGVLKVPTGEEYQGFVGSDAPKSKGASAAANKGKTTAQGYDEDDDDDVSDRRTVKKSTFTFKKAGGKGPRDSEDEDSD